MNNKYITKRLEEFEKKFGREHNGIGSNQNIIKTGQSMDELKAFSATSIHQVEQDMLKKFLEIVGKADEMIDTGDGYVKPSFTRKSERQRIIKALASLDTTK